MGAVAGAALRAGGRPASISSMWRNFIPSTSADLRSRRHVIPDAPIPSFTKNARTMLESLDSQ
jgi:hypothetical protein